MKAFEISLVTYLKVEIIMPLLCSSSVVVSPSVCTIAYSDLDAVLLFLLLTVFIALRL